MSELPLPPAARQLGASGIEVSPIAWGMWRLAENGRSSADAAKLVHAALDAGITFLDTADIYGFNGSGGFDLSARLTGLDGSPVPGLAYSLENPYRGPDGDGTLDGFVAGCCYLDAGEELGMTGLNPSASFVWINAWNAKQQPSKRLLRIKELDGVPIRQAALGDLDEDGDLDIFAAVGTLIQHDANNLEDLILLNDGLGNFTISDQRLGETDSSSVALGDLDGDGDQDALVGIEQGAEVWVNQGGSQDGQAGQFAVSEQELGSNASSEVFLSDLDGDSDQDALIAGIKQAVVWWNDGRGSFTRSNQRFNYTKRHGLAVADFTGDGFPDIFAGSYTDSYLAWLNQGDGTFRAENQQ
jgi:hypothetical protein